MSTYYHDETITLHLGGALDVLRDLPDHSINCCVTSPPYWGLRDYGDPGQIGNEATPGEYVTALRDVFREMRRVLAADGTLFLNLADSYSPDKSLMFMPHRVAMALQDDGWIARNAIVWTKPNAKPESVKDRLSTKYEMVFMFSKNRRYWFDLDPIREPHAVEDGREHTQRPRYRGGAVGMRTEAFRARSGDVVRGLTATNSNHPAGRNPGDVWSIATVPYAAAHFAVFPPELARRCVISGCKPGGIVLDPFHGSGTTGKVSVENGRKYIGIEINREDLNLSLSTRLSDGTINFGT